MFSSLSPEMLKVVGVVLILMGLFYLFRMYEALVKGKVTYWVGFLPFTLVSPWVVVVPANKKKSLVHSKEAMWVHIIMAPLFLISAALSIGAGAELLGLPGVDTLNSAFGKSGPRAIVFSYRNGYSFPFIGRSAETFWKAMSKGQVGISAKQDIHTHDQASQTNLQDAMH